MTDRITDTALNPLFLHRWSPRAYDGAAMSAEDLRTILEAGRWSPSAFNYQPWRFLYAMRGDANWDRFLDALLPFNQGWVKDAAVIVYFVSEQTMGAPDKLNYSHSFDTGAAWAMIALQAHMLGYHAHGMTGIDFAKAQQALNVPEGFRIEAAAAIGRKGDATNLPESLRARELPSNRKPLVEIAFEGPFVLPTPTGR